MRVAIPEHQGRIAPVFDCCQRVLVYSLDTETADVVVRDDWSELPRTARPARLRELQIDLIICGGISCWMEDQIEQQGVELFPWRAGGIRDALDALTNGTLSDPEYAMPGHIGYGRHRHRQRRKRKDFAERFCRKENGNAGI